MYKHERTRVVRIVLTGGPCAGKSSSLAHFTEAAKCEGFDVYTAPEAATLIFNCGLAFPESEEKILEFQKALFKLQLQMERSMTHMAATTGRPSIIIFDRGLMDGRAYMTSEMWEQLLDEVEHEADAAEFKSTRAYINALLWENKDLKKGVESLGRAAALIDAPSDRIRTLATHWAHHGDIEWAESAIDRLIES